VTITITQLSVVNLTPSLSEIFEGTKVTITATLTVPVNEAVTITLDFGGIAQVGNDYLLLENFVNITIPAGQTSTTEQFVLAAKIDDLNEGEEYVLVNIIEVSSDAVLIGKGAKINILDPVPPVKEVTDDIKNPGIEPDPLMSPNGDGAGNETFVIENIADFPDNEVLIFNRWGNEVYKIKGYDNYGKVFKGVANTGLLTNLNKDLPDGVYFYIIHTIDAGNVKRMNKGYLIMKR
jgi:gliding motility-associated-like protein